MLQHSYTDGQVAAGILWQFGHSCEQPGCGKWVTSQGEVCHPGPSQPALCSRVRCGAESPMCHWQLRRHLLLLAQASWHSPLLFFKWVSSQKVHRSGWQRSGNVLPRTVSPVTYLPLFLLIVKHHQEVRSESSASAFFNWRMPKIDTQKSNPDKTLIFSVKNAYYTNSVSPRGTDAWYSFARSLELIE